MQEEASIMKALIILAVVVVKFIEALLLDLTVKLILYTLAMKMIFFNMLNSK